MLEFLVSRSVISTYSPLTATSKSMVFIIYTSFTHKIPNFISMFSTYIIIFPIASAVCLYPLVLPAIGLVLYYGFR